MNELNPNPSSFDEELNNIRAELVAQNLQPALAVDVIRRRKIDQVVKITGRSLLIYAVDWTPQDILKAQIVSNLMPIGWSDKELLEVLTRRLPRKKGLDVLLHSPGGQIEPTEAVVDILWARFPEVRFIIPNAAKSAAAMMALSGLELLLDEVSELGPTDPQINVTRSGSTVSMPAQAILDDFAKAQKAVSSDPRTAPVWLAILQDYNMGLLSQCESALSLSNALVSKWMQSHMFAGEEDAEIKAKKIAEHLSTYGNFHSHSRRIGIEELKELGVKVFDLRKLLNLYDAVHGLYRAIVLTFEQNNVVKICENTTVS